ncbi:helix-turn-helix domain-containing protein [Streptomyces olivaceus]|uniref:helix-turn-helix domain-containing protein n=1 Tax=Streptomyces olivaceus TaxID=47716 RepID=UPI00381F4812
MFDPARLAQARCLLGMTKSHLANKLGVAPASVSQYEIGTNRHRWPRCCEQPSLRSARTDPQQRRVGGEGVAPGAFERLVDQGIVLVRGLGRMVRATGITLLRPGRRRRSNTTG